MRQAAQRPTRCELEARQWTDRGNYWLDAVGKVDRPHPLRRRNLRRPLTIAGHGARIFVESGTLVIWNGFSHYPQTQEKLRFFPADHQRPSRLILLDGSGTITFDAIDWLAEQEVPLIRLDFRGKCITALGTSTPNPELQMRQHELVRNRKASLAAATRLIARKLRAMKDLLEQDAPKTAARDAAIETVCANLKVADANRVRSLDALLGVEVTCPLPDPSV